jgi:hypothetical protein
MATGVKKRIKSVDPSELQGQGASSPSAAPVSGERDDGQRCVPNTEAAVAASGDLKAAMQSLSERIGKSKKFDMHGMVPKSPDDGSYAMAALRHIRSLGSQVIVYIRRPDVYSTDPIGLDKSVLEQLKQEPRISTCFVLWPQSGESDVAWRDTQGRWQESAGETKIYLEKFRNETQIKDLFEKIDKELNDCDSEIARRLTKKDGEILKIVESFQKEIDSFVKRRGDASADGKPLLPKWFNKAYRGKITDNMRKKCKAETSKFSLKFPRSSQLEEMPEFESGTKEKPDIEESECRVFVSNVLLGQLVEHVYQKIASKFYDDVFMKILDEVAGWFCMDGRSLLSELRTFVKAKGKATDQEDVICDLLSKEKFQLMFVGSSLVSIIPMLQSVVLPSIWDPKANKITGAYYDKQFESVLQLLRRQQGGDG